jgi:hypothetical protein
LSWQHKASHDCDQPIAEKDSSVVSWRPGLAGRGRFFVLVLAADVMTGGKIRAYANE